MGVLGPRAAPARMGKWPWYATDARLAMLVAGGTGVATGCSGMMFLFCLLLALAGIVTSVLFYKQYGLLLFCLLVVSLCHGSRGTPSHAPFLLRVPPDALHSVLTALLCLVFPDSTAIAAWSSTDMPRHC